MFNIIHCADLHLDSHMETFLTPGRAAERRQELLDNFIRMTDYARQNDVSLILIAGDLFDTDQVSPSSASALCRVILDNPGILFAYLQGNHDRGSFLSLLKQQPANLICFDRNWTSWRISPRIRLWGAELSAYAGHPEDPEAGRAFWDALRPDPACINLVMLHGTAVSSREALLSREEIPLPLLTGRGIDYLALGHIHRRQSGRLDRRGDWCYAGCLEGRGFDQEYRQDLSMFCYAPRRLQDLQCPVRRVQISHKRGHCQQHENRGSGTAASALRPGLSHTVSSLLPSGPFTNCPWI